MAMVPIAISTLRVRMKTKKKTIKLDELSEGHKEILFDILAREGIKSVVVTFSGSGDDGSVDSSDLPDKIKKIVVEGSRVSQGTVWHAAGEVTHRWKENCTVEEIIQSLCYEAIEAKHDGWENGDGAYGDFNFDVEKRKVHLDFNQQYTESELYEYDF